MSLLFTDKQTIQHSYNDTIVQIFAPISTTHTAIYHSHLNIQHIHKHGMPANYIVHIKCLLEVTVTPQEH